MDIDEPPLDLFDAVCRLDDLVEWLREQWPSEAEQIACAADALKGYIELRATGIPPLPTRSE